MGRFDLNQHSLPAFEERVAAVEADATPAWGTLTPIAMLAHLERTLEVSLGAYAVVDQSTLFSRTVLRWIALHQPHRWPRGRIKAPPGAMPRPRGGFTEQRDALLATMRRFVDTAAAEPDRHALHPLFGQLPLKTWQTFHGNHFNHHLMQFNAT